MKVEYDEQVDGAFIWLVDDVERHRQEIVREVWPPELNDAIGLLLSADGRLMGIEVQPASAHLPAELLMTAAARERERAEPPFPDRDLV